MYVYVNKDLENVYIPCVGGGNGSLLTFSSHTLASFDVLRLAYIILLLLLFVINKTKQKV